MHSRSPNHAWSPIPVDIHDTPDISGIISRSSLADQSSHSHVGQCVTKTITESADKQDIVMDPNSSTPMEVSTSVDYITAHISVQDSYSCGEGTSDCSNDSDQCEFGPNLSLPLFRYQLFETFGQMMHILWCLQGKTGQNHPGMY